jgi:hypothetical protein
LLDDVSYTQIAKKINPHNDFFLIILIVRLCQVETNLGTRACF